MEIKAFIFKCVRSRLDRRRRWCVDHKQIDFYSFFLLAGPDGRSGRSWELEGEINKPHQPHESKLIERSDFYYVKQ